MSKNKTPISQASSYQEIGEYWDAHDVSDVWDQTEPADFDVELHTEEFYYRIAPELSVQLVNIAHKQGISAETLLNLWVQEKIQHPELLS
jgi:hypothetical protein